jgi:Na+/melibiose symporter-like transporter
MNASTPWRGQHCAGAYAGVVAALAVGFLLAYLLSQLKGNGYTVLYVAWSALIFLLTWHCAGRLVKLRYRYDAWLLRGEPAPRDPSLLLAASEWYARMTNIILVTPFALYLPYAFVAEFASGLSVGMVAVLLFLCRLFTPYKDKA